jgi:hypothetical protein
MVMRMCLFGEVNVMGIWISLMALLSCELNQEQLERVEHYANFLNREGLFGHFEVSVLKIGVGMKKTVVIAYDELYETFLETIVPMLIDNTSRCNSLMHEWMKNMNLLD